MKCLGFLIKIDANVNQIEKWNNNNAEMNTFAPPFLCSVCSETNVETSHAIRNFRLFSDFREILDVRG